MSSPVCRTALREGGDASAIAQLRPQGGRGDLLAQRLELAVQGIEDAQRRGHCLAPRRGEAVTGLEPATVVQAEQAAGDRRGAVVQQDGMDALHPGGVLLT
ncbi:hypothetical protein SAMN05661080_04495 [Modestobacter sp. DSM 44400]|nr:hypothetical protein SAMN05661080_04495 [Modestobacter sp. DSM 44400]